MAERPPPESDIVRLAKLVKLCRDAQNRVLRGGDRSPSAVGAARDLERRVDIAVTWVLKPRTGRSFPDGPAPGPYDREGG